jgi:uncharacterized membrane protein YfcA
MLHATTNYTVDMVLAVLLLVGGVIGAQFGTVIGAKLKAEQLRILLATMVQPNVERIRWKVEDGG